MTLWLKKNLFSSLGNTLTTVCLLGILTYFFLPFFNWLFIDSVVFGDADLCRERGGACLAFLLEKMKFILFGFYPQDQLLRPLLAMAGFFALCYYSKETSRWNKETLILWCLSLFVFYWLLGGGWPLEVVSTSKWGGLPLTLVIAFVSLVCSYPLGILLALGRRSSLPIVKIFSVVYIEAIRAVPLISILFMASVMFPLFVPEHLTVDKLLRALIAMTMFTSSLMAEVVRGGLAGISKGQYEGAESLGFNYYQTMRWVVLPQALKKVIPPTVNVAISTFKDTSLVLIIALFDLLMTAKTSLQDTQWLGFSIEVYLFVALIYFFFCFVMGNYSRRLEKEFAR